MTNMIKISDTANPNYLARIVKIERIQKHPNADALQLVTIDYQNVVTGMDCKVGDLYVYFPVESQINSNFLRATNSYSSELLNEDQTKKGFFDKHGRVRAVKLRGEYSMGYLCPLKSLEDFVGVSLSEYVGQEFDMIGGDLIVNKYVVKNREKVAGVKQGKKPKVSRLIDGQVHLHVDTENLRKESYKIKPEDRISISYKLHGTSGWCSNVMVKRKLSLLEKILKKIGVKIDDIEYDLVYGSRKVVKNDELRDKINNNHFYGEDLWGKAAERFRDIVPTGVTLYYEIVGYTSSGAYIQEGYDYGLPVGENEVYVYRITITNSDGIVNNLSTEQIVEFCDHFNIKHVPYSYIGRASDIIKFGGDFDTFVPTLEKMYTEKDCYMCRNKNPEEGVVVRKERMFQFEAYKLKSYAFLKLETEMMDKEVIDIESEN